MSDTQTDDSIPVCKPRKRIKPDTTLPGVSRTDPSQTPFNSEELALSQSSSGTSSGDSQASFDILPEGSLTRGISDATARLLRRLTRELIAIDRLTKLYRDQHHYAILKRNLIRREIKKAQEGRENLGNETTN